MVTVWNFTMSKKMLYVWFLLLILLTYLTTNIFLPHSFMSTSDQWFENVLYGVRSPLLLNVFGWITMLGNSIVVAGIGGVTSILLIRSGVYRVYALGLVTSLIGAAGTGYVMKMLVARPRPDGLIPSVTETSFSFPSGHATAAVALYGFLAYVLCKRYPSQKPLIVSGTALIVIAVGFSRLYLGVHFPSDVLAGYLLGGLWLLMGMWASQQTLPENNQST